MSASLLFNPAPGEAVQFVGHPLGETCAFLKATGKPCLQCGMTRSWIHAARLEWGTAFWYNPAGFTLWLWLVAGGIVGAVRLGTRRWRALSPPYWLLGGWTVFWMVALYGGAWVARAFFAVNPLPP